MPGVSYSQMEPHAECNQRIDALEAECNQLREENQRLKASDLHSAHIYHDLQCENRELRETLKALKNLDESRNGTV